jgi:hypothetical protein
VSLARVRGHGLFRPTHQHFVVYLRNLTRVALSERQAQPEKIPTIYQGCVKERFKQREKLQVGTVESLKQAKSTRMIAVFMRYSQF